MPAPRPKAFLRFADALHPGLGAVGKDGDGRGKLAGHDVRERMNAVRNQCLRVRNETYEKLCRGKPAI